MTSHPNAPIYEGEDDGQVHAAMTLPNALADDEGSATDDVSSTALNNVSKSLDPQPMHMKPPKPPPVEAEPEQPSVIDAPILPEAPPVTVQSNGQHVDEDDSRALQTWLRKRLEFERATVAQQLEEWHAALLTDLECRRPGDEDGLDHDRICGNPYKSLLDLRLTPSIAGAKGGLVPAEAWTSANGGMAVAGRTSSVASNGAGLQRRFTRQASVIEGIVPLTRQTSCLPTAPSQLSLAEPTSTMRRVFSLPPGTPYERFAKIVKSQAFEGFIAVLILMNAILIGMQLQYHGLDTGKNLRIRTYHNSAEDAWPGAQEAFETLEKVFIVIFTLEVIARIVALRWKWPRSGWSWIDAITIGIALVTWIFPESLTFNPAFVRLARFGKLLRIVRVMRSNSLLSSLKLLVASIQASVNTLLWSLMVVMLMQSVAGMFLAQMVKEHLAEVDWESMDDAALAAKQKVFLYYGTFYRVMLTMFEVSFANWAPACRLLVDEVGEWYGSFFVVYRCMIGFAVLSVVQAVFIQQTIKSAQLDDDFMVEQKNREKSAYVAKLHRMFQKLDTSKAGHVCMDEFKAMLARNDLKVMMSTLEVEVDDLESLFKLLDDGDGFMSADEFVGGLQRLKGNAKSLDVLMLLNNVRRLEAKIDEMRADADHDLENNYSQGEVSPRPGESEV